MSRGGREGGREGERGFISRQARCETHKGGIDDSRLGFITSQAGN